MLVSFVFPETIDGADGGFLKAVSQKKIPANRAVGDLIQNGRKNLPHFIERQISRKIQPGTAPKDGRLYNTNLACLLRAPVKGLGALDELWKNL